jgi:hypothetical protein
VIAACDDGRSNDRQTDKQTDIKSQQKPAGLSATAGLNLAEGKQKQQRETACPYANGQSAEIGDLEVLAAHDVQNASRGQEGRAANRQHIKTGREEIDKRASGATKHPQQHQIPDIVAQSNCGESARHTLGSICGRSSSRQQSQQNTHEQGEFLLAYEVSETVFLTAQAETQQQKRVS